MNLRTFKKTDWYGFAGAEGWGINEPLITEGTLANGMDFTLVLDRNGALLVLDDENAIYGGYLLKEKFETEQEAREFAEKIGEPKTKEDFGPVLITF